jgi:hypothetical protein
MAEFSAIIDTDRQDPEAPICGVDMYPEEPGHYICDEPAKNRFPHHSCGLHHSDEIDCDTVAGLIAIDEQLLSYAR